MVKVGRRPLLVMFKANFRLPPADRALQYVQWTLYNPQKDGGSIGGSECGKVPLVMAMDVVI